MAAKRQPRVADTDKIPTQRVNLQLSVDAYLRLGIHCKMEGKNPGETVTELIEQYLKAWNMPARNPTHNPAKKASAGSVAPSDRHDAADDVNATAQQAA